MTRTELNGHKNFMDFLVGVHKGLEMKGEAELAELIDVIVARLSDLIYEIESLEGIAS